MPTKNISGANLDDVTWRFQDNGDGTVSPIVASAGSGSVSTANTSTVPLGAGETFTGEWEDNALSQVLVNVLADQGGSLVIEFGHPDGSGGYTTVLSAARPIYAGVPAFRTLVKGARAARVVYTNGPTPQAAFSLFTSYADTGLFPASSSPDNEVQTTVTESLRDVFAAVQGQDIAATAYHVLVDLSDTTGFPHDRTGRIDLTNVYLFVDRAATSTGSVQLGVVTRVDGTDADVTFVQGVSFDKTDARTITRDRKFSPSALRLGVIAGEAVSVASGFKATTALVNTGATLPSPAGPVTPAVGDVVVAFNHNGGGLYTAAVSATYHGEFAP